VCDNERPEDPREEAEDPVREELLAWHQYCHSKPFWWGKDRKKQGNVGKGGRKRFPRFTARKNLMMTKKRVFPCQNKTRSDGEKHSPMQYYVYTIYNCNLQGKKLLLLGSDAGRYLIRLWACLHSSGLLIAECLTALQVVFKAILCLIGR
jgi:hypothetical protein